MQHFNVYILHVPWYQKKKKKKNKIFSALKSTETRAIPELNQKATRMDDYLCLC